MTFPPINSLLNFVSLKRNVCHAVKKLKARYGLKPVFLTTTSPLFFLLPTLSPGCCLLLIWDQPMRSAQVIMVTFTEPTQVSPMELREPTCLAASLSPGLRRKKMLWQNAVKHIIIQQELSAQVTDYPTAVMESIHTVTQILYISTCTVLMCLVFTYLFPFSAAMYCYYRKWMNVLHCRVIQFIKCC